MDEEIKCPKCGFINKYKIIKNPGGQVDDKEEIFCSNCEYLFQTIKSNKTYICINNPKKYS